MVIEVDTEEPILIYKKIIGNPILSSIDDNGVEFDITWKHDPRFDFSALNKLIETMWDGYEVDAEDQKHTRETIQSRIDSGLHDCRIECETGSWWFIDREKTVPMFKRSMRDTDSDYLGSYQLKDILPAFDDGYGKEMVERLYEDKNHSTIGDAMKNQVGVLDKFIATLYRNYNEKDLLGNEFNHEDSKCHEVMLGGTTYYYFHQ